MYHANMKDKPKLYQKSRFLRRAPRIFPTRHDSRMATYIPYTALIPDLRKLGSFMLYNSTSLPEEHSGRVLPAAALAHHTEEIRRRISPTNSHSSWPARVKRRSKLSTASLKKVVARRIQRGEIATIPASRPFGDCCC
jgi:hypothetical protein